MISKKSLICSTDFFSSKLLKIRFLQRYFQTEMLERIEQRKPTNTFQHTVYHEVPRDPLIPNYGQRPVSAMGYPSGNNYRDNYHSYPVMYNNQAQTQLTEENRRLKARVRDLESRVDHLLRGQNDIESGSKTMNTIWDEIVTQLCELFGASIEDKEDKVAATTVVLARAREVKSEMIELQAKNAQVIKSILPQNIQAF